jgi:hypothetical protein
MLYSSVSLKKPLISLLVLGTNISWMSLTLFGFTLIPLLLTTNSNNFPDLTLNVYFAGFNFNYTSSISQRVFSKFARNPLPFGFWLSYH